MQASLFTPRPQTLLTPPPRMWGACSATCAAQGRGPPLPEESPSVDGRLERGHRLPNAGHSAVAGQIVSDEVAAKRPRKEAATRARATAVIAGIARDFLGGVQSVVRIVDEEGSLSDDSASLEAMLATKSTGTLVKRASSLRMYRAWFVSSGVEADSFFGEKTVFKYVRSLFLDNAPPTRASTIRETFNFLDGIFEHDLTEIRKSARVLGMTVQILRSKAEVRQRKPLTVKMVRCLEGIVIEDRGSGHVDAVLAGAALMAAYGRVRVWGLAPLPS